MDTPSYRNATAPPRPSTLRDLPATEPHLPLRKAEPKRLHAPRPLWNTSQHQLRGFNPSPVQAVPRIDNFTASNEHAFAGREENRRRPFKVPVYAQGMPQVVSHAMQQGQDIRTQYAERPASSRTNGGPPSSPLLPPTPAIRGNGKSLRSSKSLGEGLKGLKHRFSQPSRPNPHDQYRHASSPVPPMTANSLSQRPSMASSQHDHVRESFKSALTSNSSLVNTSSINTEHSSMTGNSPHSDFVNVYPNWPNTEQEQDGYDSVDDVLGMYEEGFTSAKQSLDNTAVKRSMDTQGRRSQLSDRPMSQPSEAPERAKRPDMAHRRSQSASLLDRFQKFGNGGLAPPGRYSIDGKRRSMASSMRPASILEDDPGRIKPLPAQPLANGTTGPPQPPQGPVPRDRHGFKTASNYYTPAQYAAWNAPYSAHLSRRQKKWHALMASYGLDTATPFRFPPKSDKIKRYVRKGIPSELRGAAWFWYAGGPKVSKEHPGRYWELVERTEKELGENDREHIERDLNRTFPDNVRFKPDPTTTLDAQSGAGGGAGDSPNSKRKKGKKSASEPETSITSSLRRVLQAFALHKPEVGYCQSLNFIAGLLLLNLENDAACEEKAFILLDIVTSTHLPGTHGVALEGANVDIAVLMGLVRDSLPQVWAKLDDKGTASVGGVAEGVLGLPTVSLATTAWFMSLFVGTLPIECVLRVWDCLFFEGSKVLFRTALAIFKAAQPRILQVSDPMEVFQLVQTLPRGLLDVNCLLDVAFKRRGGFGHVSQELVERRRADRRGAVKAGVEGLRGDLGWFKRFRGGGGGGR